ncbi:MAG: hypothetical protein D6706_00955 [Chloroflexi bacterium]|nr:MAG: hypothetical protein D6706_00955 [Chloroflexota bacterium]
MDCIITAGGIPGPDDPLYEYAQGKPKALIDMNGRTMLERVVDAFQHAQSVDDIVIVGLGDDMGMQFQRPVHHLPDHGSLLGNVLAGVRWLREQKGDVGYVLLSSADVPTLTGEIIDDFVARCQPLDKAVYYNFVTKEAMERRFPHSNRTYVKLKGVQIAGGDVVLADSVLADSHQELWEQLTNARKHAWKLAKTVGLWPMLKLLFRQLSIEDIENLFLRVVGRPAKIILNPHAEIAMDADKPHQVDLLREDLQQREQAKN